MVALEKARRLASSTDPVLFLCYNSALKNYLRANHAHPNVRFATFHGFAREIAGPHGTLEDSENAVLDHLLGDQQIPYTHLIVDEGQDFEADWLEALAYKFRDGVFYVFYDRHQLVRKGDLKRLDDIPCRLVLTRNCRNTDAIARVAYRAAALTISPTLGIAGPKPLLHRAANQTEAIGIATKIMQAAAERAKVPPHEFAILSLETLPESSPWRAIKVSGHTVSDKPAAGSITLSSARKFKGLEASLVVVADVDFRKAEDIDWRRRLYVACSRARQAVHIITTTPESELQGAVKAFSGTDKVRASWRSLTRELGARLAEGEIDDPFKEP